MTELNKEALEAAIKAYWGDPGYTTQGIVAAIQAYVGFSALAQRPKVSVKPMTLSDDRTDYFVSISVGDREITPYVFRGERFKAEYEAASFRWLLLGEAKPDLMAYSENGWPDGPSVTSTDREASK